MTTARGFDNSSISFTRNYTLTASSANDQCGPYAVLNSIFDDIRVPAGSTNQFTIQARDTFGNLNPATLVATTFQPDLTPPANPLVSSLSFPQTGYFYYPFYSTKAGNFYLYTGLDNAGLNINYGSGPPYGPYPVLIDPGLANRTNSYCQGAALTSTQAGTWATVQLVLNDRWNNPINFQNPYDTISANLVFANNGSVVLPFNLSWQDGAACQKCVLKASVFPTIASIPGVLGFQIMLNVNGDIAPCGTPDIVPGPLYPPTCTFDLSGIVPNPSPAGKLTSFIIQAKDQYGNNRRTPNTPYDNFVISTNPAVSGLDVSYAGNGQYLVSLSPLKKGNNSVTVLVSSTGQGDVTTAGNMTVGTQQLRVIPGDAGQPSTYSGISNLTIVVAGTLNSFTITSYDQYSNLRDNQPYGIAVANQGDYYLRFFEPTKQIDAISIAVDPTATPNFATSGIYTVRFNATLVGFYRLTVQTVPGAAAISNSPVYPVQVVPGCTHPPSTIFAGSGTSGGISGTTVNFTMTARDLWTNVQADYRDLTLYNALVQPYAPYPAFNASITTLPGLPGNFLVTYVVPTNTGNNPLNFTITVCHPGKNGTTGVQCYPPWCRVFQAGSSNPNTSYYGIITVANGTAGTQSNWVIDDQLADGSVPPVLQRVSSWTVTVTRVVDNAAAAPSLLVACNSDTTGACITSPRVLWNVSFTPTTNIGYFQVRVYAYGVETNQSKNAGIFVWINPGPVYPPNCQVFGLSTTIGAGVAGQFEVSLKDQWFHNITDGGETVLANTTLASKGLLASWSSGWNLNNNQRFVFSYVLNTTGSWQVHIRESVSFAGAANPLTAGQEIGAGLTITVVPGPANCLTSYVKGVVLASSSPPSWTKAGTQVSFIIIPLDMFGNPVVDTTTTFTIVDSGGNSTFKQIVRNSALPPAIEVQVLYTPYIIDPSGNNTITVQIGTPLCNLVGPTPLFAGDVPQPSPLIVTVDPDDIFPGTSSVVAAGTTPSPITAGQPMQLTLKLKDRYGNNWFSNQPSQLTAFVNVPASANNPPQQALAAPLPLGAGQYSFTLSGQNTHLASAWVNGAYVADYSWSVSAVGTPITGAGLIPTSPVVVQAGPTSPPDTLAPSPYPVISDVLRTYNVTLQDQYGNQKFTGADSDVVAFTWMVGTIDCTPGEIRPPSNNMNITTTNTAYLGNGVFAVTILGSTIGLFTLNLTVTPMTPPAPLGWYGSPNCIPTGKLVQQVLPGEASPPNSWWTINKQNFSAGESASIFLQVRDKRNNDILRSGTPLAWSDTLVPGVNVTGFPPTGPDTSTLPSGWTLAPFGNLPNPWVKPDFSASTPSLPIAPGQAPTLGSQVDYGNSSYSYMITFYKAGDALPLVLSMRNATGNWVAVPWPPELASDAAVNVSPGPPRQFSPTMAQLVNQLQNMTHTIAAVPAQFILTAYDNYGNVLGANSNATFTVELQSQVNGYTVPVTAMPGPNPGKQRLVLHHPGLDHLLLSLL